MANGGVLQSLVPAVDRAVLLLQAVGNATVPPTESDLIRLLRLNKSTAHNILAALCRHHLLERDAATKTFRLGYRLVELARNSMETMDPRDVAHPHMAKLAESVGESVFLGVFADGFVTIIDKAETDHFLKITAPLGRRIPYSAGAYGKVFLAAMAPAQIVALFKEQPLRAYTKKSITRANAYRAELMQVRRQSYALDVEEYRVGLSAVAAPIVDRYGRVTATLCVVGNAARLPPEQLRAVAQQVCQVAGTISRELGAVEYPAWKGIV